MSEIFTIHRLSWNAPLFQATLLAFSGEQAQGKLPEHRRPPTGDETAIWAGGETTPSGIALVYETGHKRLWLDLLWVRPSLRRMGVGSMLMGAVRDHAINLGFERIELGTKIENNAMHRLALKHRWSDEAFLMSSQLRSYL